VYVIKLSGPDVEEWSITPDCARHADALNRIRMLLATEGATPGLRLYITTYPGRRFDKELDHQAVDELLRPIPSDMDIWEVPGEELLATLGPDSPAWRLRDMACVRGSSPSTTRTESARNSR
jgi:hypothetical protein